MIILNSEPNKKRSTELILKGQAEGKFVEWGAFLSGGGYAVVEGTPADVVLVMAKYVPWAHLKPFRYFQQENQMNYLTKSLVHSCETRIWYLKSGRVGGLTDRSPCD
jgi:hypothetical protein